MQKNGVSHKHTGPLILKKIKCISSPEQNYFAHFAMRYPVTTQTFFIRLAKDNLKV